MIFHEEGERQIKRNHDEIMMNEWRDRIKANADFTGDDYYAVKLKEYDNLSNQLKDARPKSEISIEIGFLRAALDDVIDVMEGYPDIWESDWESEEIGRKIYKLSSLSSSLSSEIREFKKSDQEEKEGAEITAEETRAREEARRRNHEFIEEC